jgi:hypothetical protein
LSFLPVGIGHRLFKLSRVLDKKGSHTAVILPSSQLLSYVAHHSVVALLERVVHSVRPEALLPDVETMVTLLAASTTTRRTGAS